MKRVAIFAVLIGLGLLVAPGVAQSTGFGSSVAEELDPVEDAEAHVASYCLTQPCVCWWDETGFHCH